MSHLSIIPVAVLALVACLEPTPGALGPDTTEASDPTAQETTDPCDEERFASAPCEVCGGCGDPVGCSLDGLHTLEAFVAAGDSRGSRPWKVQGTAQMLNLWESGTGGCTDDGMCNCEGPMGLLEPGQPTIALAPHVFDGSWGCTSRDAADGGVSVACEPLHVGLPYLVWGEASAPLGWGSRSPPEAALDPVGWCLLPTPEGLSGAYRGWLGDEAGVPCQALVVTIGVDDAGRLALTVAEGESTVPLVDGGQACALELPAIPGQTEALTLLPAGGGVFELALSRADGADPSVPSLAFCYQGEGLALVGAFGGFDAQGARLSGRFRLVREPGGPAVRNPCWGWGESR